MTRIQDYIRSLTPFLGVSPDRLIPLIEKVRLEFKVYDKGDRILYPGMKAHNLFLLLNGHVVIEREPYDGVRVSWKVPEGQPIDLPAMYGLSQSHGLTARAVDRAEVVSIDKAQFRHLYEAEPIILINLINSLGRAASYPPVISGDNGFDLWINSLSTTYGGNSPIRVDVKLQRLSEILSIPLDTLKDHLDERHRRGMIKWVPEENAMFFRPQRT